MSGHLPVPVPRQQLVLPGAGLAAHRTSIGRAAHRRRPRLERVTCLSFGGGLLAAAGGRVCCVWDTRTHELVARLLLALPIGAVWIERTSGRTLMLAAGTEVAVFDLPRAVLSYAHRHAAEVTSVHISDGSTVAGSVDTLGHVEIHDIAAGQRVQRIETSPGRPRVFVDRGRHVLVDSGTHSSIYDAATGALRRRFPYDPLERLDLDGLLLNSTLVAPSERWLRWFDCSTHAHARCVRDLGSTIQSIDIDNGRALALAATEAGTIGVFDLDTGEPRACHQSFTVPLMFARFGADASIYVAGGEALVMHLVDGRHERSYYDESAPLVAMTLPEAAGSVLLSNRDGGLTAVSLRNGRPCASLHGHRGSVSVVTVFGDCVAGGAYDGVLRVFSASTSALLMACDLAQGPIQAITADVRARRLWVGTWAGRVNEVSLDSGEVGASVQVFPSSVRSLALDADRRLLCAGGDAGELRLVDLSATPPQPLAAGLQSGTAYRVRFDSDGSVLVTAADGVRRYCAADLTVRETFAGQSIRWFDQAAGRIVALSLGGELTIFDEATHEVQCRALVDSPVNHRSVAFAGAKRLFVASADGLMRVFDERLQLVATLELVRNGFLWTTPTQEDGHPGWLHTDSDELVEVGERAADGELEVWDAADPRRARHLVKWTSASHVMEIVSGDAAPLRAVAGRSGSILALAPIDHRLGWWR